MGRRSIYQGSPSVGRRRHSSVDSHGSRSNFRVQFDSRQHLSVIFQCQGSIWPTVLPYCIFNVIVLYLKVRYLNSTMDERGFIVTGYAHTISVFIVSFFLVSQSNMSLRVYDSARTNVENMLFYTRSLVSAVAITTEDDQSTSAKEWRNEVAYYSCLLLKLCITVLTKDRLPWTIPELSGKIKQQLMEQNPCTGDTHQLSHELRTEWQEACRTPSTMAYFLRRLLKDGNKSLEEKIHPLSMSRFNGHMDGLMYGYHDLLKYLKLGFAPFPLIQMAKTMLFIWVFSLPFCLHTDPSSFSAHAILVFFLTYSFMGLESVSCELEDPFDGDENDLDVVGVMEYLFEDVYNIIDVVDGPEWAKKVQMKMSGVGASCFEPVYAN